MKRTPLHDWHVEHGARMVEFAGWEMPLHYGSQMQEHRSVRQEAGLFDVSHMAIVDVTGPGARRYLRYLLANDVARLTRAGAALYTCLLNERGGIVDDLIVYHLTDDRFRLVVNAATRAKDLAWFEQHAAGIDVAVGEQTDLAFIAVQGPTAREKALAVLEPSLRARAQALAPFQAAWEGATFVSRTGYTGEDGFEIMLPAASSIGFAEALSQAGVAPAGLAARDTLRVEAGLNLYGADMDESVTPLESGLAWTVAWEPQERSFIGRDELEAQRRQGVSRGRVGLVLEERGVLRNQQEVFAGGQRVGEVTSGSFSPTLGRSIALARVERGTGDGVSVQVRERQIAAQVVKPPFVRHGTARADLERV